MTDEVMDYDEASLIGINGVKSGTSLVICLLSMAREVWVPADVVVQCRAVSQQVRTPVCQSVH